MMRLSSALLLSLALGAGAQSRASAASAPVLASVADVPFPGTAARFDYQSIDTGANRLYISHMNVGELVVFDLKAQRVEGTIGDLPHGMSLDAGGRLLFVANEGSATLLIVDLRTVSVMGHVPVGEDPDVLAFDPEWHRLYVATESGDVTVFTEHKGSLALEGRITMPHAHTVCVDPRTHLVYFPLQDVEGQPLLRIMRSRVPRLTAP